jgi:hypothetical protein
LVLKGLDANYDLPTLERWASEAGVSYSSLRAACELVAIKPHDARDFLRMLRAVVRLQTASESFEASLDVHDIRTMRSLLERSGLTLISRGHRITLNAFLQRQHFIPASNEGLKRLVILLRRRNLTQQGEMS